MAPSEQTDGSFEERFRLLEETVSSLEQGRLSLDESLAGFEQGMRLAHDCLRLLEEAELRVTRLLSDESFADDGEAGGDLLLASD